MNIKSGFRLRWGWNFPVIQKTFGSWWKFSIAEVQLLQMNSPYLHELHAPLLSYLVVEVWVRSNLFDSLPVTSRQPLIIIQLSRFMPTPLPLAYLKTTSSVEAYTPSPSSKSTSLQYRSDEDWVLQVCSRPPLPTTWTPSPPTYCQLNKDQLNPETVQPDLKIVYSKSTLLLLSPSRTNVYF